jgi:hypothetical protein
VDRVIGAISDPTRRAILAQPARGPARISDVARWIFQCERFWNTRLDRLEEFFAAKQEKIQ